MNSGTVKEAYMLLLCLNFSGACLLLSSSILILVSLLIAHMRTYGSYTHRVKSC